MNREEPSQTHPAQTISENHQIGLAMIESTTECGTGLIPSSYPTTHVEPVTDVLHGICITDPYRWLEAQNSPRTRNWIAEQTAYARRHLDAIPGRERIRTRVEQLLNIEVVSEPWKIGDRFFYLKRKANQEQAAIMMRAENSLEETVLIDPATRDEATIPHVSIIKISQSCSVLAYGVRQSGSDSQSVEFLDIARRQILPDRLPNGFGPSLVFSPDGLGFYYSHETIDCSRPFYRAVYFHEFGHQAQNDAEVFFGGEGENLHVAVFGSTDGSRLGYLLYKIDNPVTYKLWVYEPANSTMRKVIETEESLFCPFFAGHNLCALTSRAAPNWRIVKIHEKHPEPDRWLDIVPESQCRIDSYAVLGDSICVSYVEKNSSRIEEFELDGRRKGRVPCPSPGTAGVIRRFVESDTLFYEFSGLHQPPAILSYRSKDRELKIWATRALDCDPTSVELNEVHYKSRDGTVVPMFLAAQKGRLSKGCLPTMLTGYGGFGFNHNPRFQVSTTVLMERGFLFAIANVRGGGELGEQWHLAGKKHNRQNAFDDFICAAEWLVENGYSAPGKVAISGGSNAGLLVAAALTQRPELFSVVVCSAPVLDMLRYHLFDSAHRYVDEYGCSENREDFPHLLAYSPYHHVKEGTPYPAVMFISGDADTRCNPMHVRKMTARLQSSTTSGNPVLLDYKPSWGHVQVQALSERIEGVTDRLAFICHELGVEP